MTKTRQKRFTDEAEAILYAQLKVKQYNSHSTIIKFTYNGQVTYRVYHAKSRTTVFDDCREGEGMIPFGWIYRYQPGHLSKASEKHFLDIKSKRESFKINPDGTLEIPKT